jgi:cysteine desulfurase
MIQKNQRYVYLDYAASTPIDENVLQEMYTFDTHHFSNPSSIYTSGDFSRRELDSQRNKLARTLQARSSEIYFTYGGTESDNLAIRGTVAEYKKNNPEKTPHVIVSSIEHAAVLDTVADLEKEGVKVTRIKPKKNGIVRALDFIEACTPDTVLMSLMYVNNEIGTVQPVGALGTLVREYREAHNTIYPLLHTDACQAGNYLLVTAPKLKADLITINGSKVYGPKGIGALYIRTGTQISPIITGGGQEGGLRSGTENLSLIIGLVSSFVLAQSIREEEAQRVELLQKTLVEGLKKTIPNCIIWGDITQRIANNVSVHIPGISAEELVIRLASHGIEVSSKSACSSIDTDGSYVILEVGGTDIQARQTLRITMGRKTNMEDIQYFLHIIETIIKKYTVCSS